MWGQFRATRTNCTSSIWILWSRGKETKWGNAYRRPWSLWWAKASVQMFRSSHPQEKDREQCLSFRLIPWMPTTLNPLSQNHARSLSPLVGGASILLCLGPCWTGSKMPDSPALAPVWPWGIECMETSPACVPVSKGKGSKNLPARWFRMLLLCVCPQQHMAAL